MNWSTVLSLLIKLAIAAAVVYGLVVFLAWRYQDRLAFPGPSGPLPPPEAAGIPSGERVTVETADGVQLKGWLLPAEPASAEGKTPGVIWFYGNMETVGDLAPILRRFRPPDMAMLVLDYRGYGESEGTPTEAGLYRDGEAAWRYLTSLEHVDPERIAVYGRSLGSAVALHLANAYPVRAVVLDSPFTSGRDMADEHYGLLPPGLLRLELDNVARARALRVPLLIFHGTEDRIAPIDMGRTLAEVGDAEAFVAIEGAGHNDTYDVGGAAYRERFHAFLRETLR